jgi:hypothetical protein
MAASSIVEPNAHEAPRQCFHQPGKGIALALRQVGPLTLREHREQEHGNIGPAKKGNDAVTTTFALAASCYPNLPAATRVLDQVTGARVFSDLDNRAFALSLVIPAAAAATKKARVSMTVCMQTYTAPPYKSLDGADPDTHGMLRVQPARLQPREFVDLAGVG